MKKILLALTLMIGILVESDPAISQVAMYKGPVRVRLTYPDGITSSKTFTFPTFDMQTPAFANTLAVTVTDLYTYIKPASITHAATLNLTVSSSLTAGAWLCLDLTSDSTRNVTLGTGFFAPVFLTQTSKRKVQWFLYDGSLFIPGGTPYQIN